MDSSSEASSIDMTSTMTSRVDPNLLCAICGGLLQEAVLTPCGHSFCQACLYTWLSRDNMRLSTVNTCPECRGVVRLREVRPILAIRNLIKNLGNKDYDKGESDLADESSEDNKSITTTIDSSNTTNSPNRPSVSDNPNSPQIPSELPSNENHQALPSRTLNEVPSSEEEVVSSDGGQGVIVDHDRPECIGCSLICMTWNELLEHQTRCEVIAASLEESLNSYQEASRELVDSTSTGSRGGHNVSRTNAISPTQNHRLEVGQRQSNPGTNRTYVYSLHDSTLIDLENEFGIDLAIQSNSSERGEQRSFESSSRSQNYPRDSSRENLNGSSSSVSSNRDFNCCSTRLSHSNIGLTAYESPGHFRSNHRTHGHRSLSCEVTDLAFMVATLELELKRVKRDLETADVRNQKLDRELKRTKDELEVKRVQLLDQQYTEFDPNYNYGFDPNTISTLSCLISKFLLKKPPYVNKERIFSAVKRCYDNFSRSEDEYAHDVHMLVATAYASNWFSEAQKLSFHCWLQSIASFREFNPGTSILHT